MVTQCLPLKAVITWDVWGLPISAVRPVAEVYTSYFTHKLRLHMPIPFQSSYHLGNAKENDSHLSKL